VIVIFTFKYDSERFKQGVKGRLVQKLFFGHKQTGTDTQWADCFIRTTQCRATDNINISLFVRNEVKHHHIILNVKINENTTTTTTAAAAAAAAAAVMLVWMTAESRPSVFTARCYASAVY